MATQTYSSPQQLEAGVRQIPNISARAKNLANAYIGEQGIKKATTLSTKAEVHLQNGTFALINANSDTLTGHNFVSVLSDNIGGATRKTAFLDTDGRATLIGGLGAESLVSLHGNNFIIAADDPVTGAVTTIKGGTGFDTLEAGNHTHVYAGTGQQTLIGGTGQDTLDGRGDIRRLTFIAERGGDELLIGGGGRNKFVVGKGDITIKGGTSPAARNDVFVDRGGLVNVKYGSGPTGSSALLTFGDGDTIKIDNVKDIANHIKFT